VISRSTLYEQMAVMDRAQNDKSVGSKIVARLKGFVEAVESGQDPSQRFTCRTVPLNLEPSLYGPDLVKSTRMLLGVSQAIFAQFLGVSASAVQDWEQGKKPPNGSACRLMDEIRRDPTYWRERLRELSSPISASASGQ
jgi:putative transcriptional regulator